MIYNVDLDKKPVNKIVVGGLKAADIQGHNGWQVTRVETDDFSPVTEVWLQLKREKEKTMGKKYIIELEDKVSENAKGEPLYFVKGFNNLSLDETALKKLTPYNESEHEFKVGDVVEYKTDCECAKIGIITKLTPDSVSILLADGGVRNPSWHYKDDTYTLKYIKSMPSSLHSLINLMTWKNEDLV